MDDRYQQPLAAFRTTTLNSLPFSPPRHACLSPQVAETWTIFASIPIQITTLATTRKSNFTLPLGGSKARNEPSGRGCATTSIAHPHRESQFQDTFYETNEPIYSNVNTDSEDRKRRIVCGSFEGGPDGRYSAMRAARFNLPWILEGSGRGMGNCRNGLSGGLWLRFGSGRRLGRKLGRVL